MTKTTSQPWIYSARVDGAFILAPALVITALVALFHERLAQMGDMPVWVWALLIVGVDVAHVYSTLYRTYFDRDELQARQTLYILTPLLGWLFFVALYSIDFMLFWRVLAYLAVFHFMRQQYGFMMIYGRRDGGSKRIDQLAIYMATLYPLIYWHTHARDFQWFLPGDFLAANLPWLHPLALVAYVATAILYIAKEIGLRRTGHAFNWPRNLLLLGTALSWGVGIVVFNNDLAFTATNVIAHGVPYLALIWIFGRNQSRVQAGKSYFGKVKLSRFFSLAWLPVFIGLLLLFAYVEEGLWDAFVWTEHRSIFAPFSFLAPVVSKEMLTWLVPLLALPQITHYMLDAFIWRLKSDQTPWKNILFYESKQVAI